MPGSLDNGGAYIKARPNNAKAYCEGRVAQANGAAISTNPHLTYSEDFQSWEKGWADEALGAAAGPCAPTGITPSPPAAATAVATTPGGTDSVPAVITLAGTFLGDETFNVTSVTDVLTTPVVSALAVVPGTAAENAIHLAAALNADADATDDRLWTANGNTIECLADSGSVTVTLSAVSVTG